MHLDTHDHDRGSAGLTYVYPVVSRRAGGVSVGINLNPNDACNWRCVYCQVPGLVYGNAPELDLELLERELRSLLGEIVQGDWMERRVPEGSRRLNDVALSGNGEPTSSEQLPEVVRATGRVLTDLGLVGQVKLILITNGSMMHRAHVREALGAMAELHGEVWFKLDSATEAGQARLNTNRAGIERVRANLETAAGLCPTWIQTLVLDWDGPSFAGAEGEAYLELVGDLARRRVPLRGVLLYGLARTSHQPEAQELSALPREWLEDFAQRIEAAGLTTRVHL